MFQGTNDSPGHWKLGDRVAIVRDGDVPDGTFVDQLLAAWISCSTRAASSLPGTVSVVVMIAPPELLN